MNLSYIRCIGLFLLIGFSLFTDLRNKKIPNTITITGMIFGIGINTIIAGMGGLQDSIKGMIVAFVFTIVPFIIGGIGGGDLKLLLAVGALMGMSFVVMALAYTAATGAVIAIILSIYYKRLRISLRNIKNYLLCTILTQKLVVIEQKEQPVYFPYSVAIAIGSVAAFFNNLL